MVKQLIAVTCFSLFAFSASSHPGDKDEYGCHVDHATDIKHCHDKTGKVLSWPPVKKSRSDIRHDRDSQWYDLTIHFEPFNTLKEYIESGGRLPKS